MHNFKVIIKMICCVLICGIVIKALDIALYPCTFMRNDVHTVATEQKDVIILGTSCGKMDLNPDIILEGTSMTGHNLCVGGEYPIDSYYLTKLMIEKQNPKKIIYEVDPGYFISEKEEGNNYLLFYHEFPMSKAKAEYYMDTMMKCDFRTTLFPFYEYPLSYELGKVGETASRKLAGDYDVAHLKGTVQEYHENGQIEKYPVALEDMPQMSPTLFSRSLVKESNMEYLSRLIQLCEDNNIEFVAATMPQPAMTLSAYPENFKDAWTYFSDYFESENVKYYNFNVEYYDAFPHDMTQFVDYNGHMNGESADAFSRVFGQIINEQ